MTDAYYVINQNDGIDTLHRNPREECNIDDAEGRSTLDAKTGQALEESGDIHRCGHCYTDQEG